ncbi:hypothetical protein AB1399_03955, partial [Hydrogenibacillus schlegelii]
PEVKRVVLSADLPNPGYRLAVVRVEFSDDGRGATIVYRIEAPIPDGSTRKSSRGGRRSLTSRPTPPSWL